MSSHMEDDLRNYRLQLQQVEAALTTDTANEELIKLKGDLEEVIELTRDLLRAQREDEMPAAIVAAPPAAAAAAAVADDDVTNSLLAAERQVNQVHVQTHRMARRNKWKIGDKCYAKWQQDGAYYEAAIEEIMDCQVRVLYTKYNQLQVCHIDALKDVPESMKRSADGSGENDHKYGKIPSRDYLKKKKQKKQQRFKQIEEERESEKNKWISFTSKSAAKKVTGPKGKSIFASPDNVNGRVGIGTCGISGKPMTEFSHGEMWRKGT